MSKRKSAMYAVPMTKYRKPFILAKTRNMVQLHFSICVRINDFFLRWFYLSSQLDWTHFLLYKVTVQHIALLVLDSCRATKRQQYKRVRNRRHHSNY